MLLSFKQKKEKILNKRVEELQIELGCVVLLSQAKSGV
jgi:hypothetical protein